MADFPGGRLSVSDGAPNGILSTGTLHSQAGQAVQGLGTAWAGQLWPAANLAIYMPVMVPEPITVFQMSVEVTAQAGNMDLGIYSEDGVRLVSNGSVAVGAAGLQTVNIADTALTPGLYYLAMCCSDATTAAFLRGSGAAPVFRASGLLQQAVGAVTLPSPATFAAYAQGVFPIVMATFTATTV